MTQALAETSQQPLSLFHIPGCEFSEVELKIEPGLRFDLWQRLLESLERAEQGIQWYLGDALNYGEHEYGERYAQVLDAHEKTGVDVDTLRNYQWVAGKVKPVTRVTTLSWSVHREVATLSETKQRKVLEKLTKESTVKEARREAHRIKREEGREKTEIELLQSPEVQEWFSGLYKAVLPLESSVPTTAPFLRGVARGYLSSILKNSERTVESDCDEIMEMFTGEDGIYSATDDQIYKWLLSRLYFISDPELDDRLQLLCHLKRLKYIKTGGRKEGQKGEMIWVYMPFDSKVIGERPSDRRA